MAQGSPGHGCVAVIGAGAIGGFFAAKLHEAGHEVTLCVRTPIERLVLEQAGERREAAVRIATDPTPEKTVAWVFVATKAQDTAGAEAWIRALSDAGTTVVVLQNGIDHAERVKPFAPASSIVPAVVYCGAERVSPGHIVHHQSSRLIVPEGEASRSLGSLFAETGVEVVPTPDFLTASWRKLLANVAANPITALTMRRIGVLREPGVNDLAHKLLAEAVAVGRAAGAKLTPEDAKHVLDAQCRLDEGAGDLLQVCAAGQDWIDGPSRKADGGAGA
jgi:2-dehydropantoate 2-reductase